MWKNEGASLPNATERLKEKFELQTACFIYDIVTTCEKHLYFPTKRAFQ